MAMQLLWDFRKTFRCAVLTGSPSDITDVAMEVVSLFTAGSRGHQNTVLLLVNDEQKLEDLQESIMKTIAEQQIVTRMPVVTLLSCVRKDVVLQNDQVVLKTELSDTEKQKFNEKMEELKKKYGQKYNQLHGFSIMQTNFSQAYIKKACTEFGTVRKAKRPRKNQLAAFLSLLNAYVPGSYLLESQCLDFLEHEDDGSLDNQMEPFSNLMITFQQDERSEKKVRMVHPALAKHYTELLSEGGVTRSDTARNFLNNFCGNEVPSFLLGFVKDMLTKREMNEKEKEEKFSRLILDIAKEVKNNDKRKNNAQSASVLKVASKKFDQNPLFPQALARFSYIEQKNYNLAEMWAKRAKERDPRNSFVADTLGQVHKNHLKNHLKNWKSTATPRQILQLAKKAIEAFKHEEQLAKEEQGEDMRGDGAANISYVFNSRGQFGYLQVCVLLYDLLVPHNGLWRSVLTKEESMCNVLDALGDNKLYRFNDLINSLRDEVERKGDFFEKYLTYSKINMEKDDPDYISRDTDECYRKYVGDSTPSHIHPNAAILIQKLKQSLPDRRHVELLSYLVRDYTESELKEATTRWKRSSSSTDSVNNMLADFRQKIPLSRMDAPELHMLALLLCWPENEDRRVIDLNQLIDLMHNSYEDVYKKYFRSRYLLPLFFIGQGQDLNRIVHREQLMQSEETPNGSNVWSNESIFRNPSVQERLVRVEGVVRNYRVYAAVDGKEIAVDANRRNSLWRRRQVSFYLGFTISGPVAFDIQTKTPETGSATASGQHSVDQHGTTQMNNVSNPGEPTQDQTAGLPLVDSSAEHP
uniref:Uncharacterized protein n=1 Tax=Acanthochromis polyacanthus TaxID=80966 RepID=A0A3Q1GDC1_9TELE